MTALLALAHESRASQVRRAAAARRAQALELERQALDLEADRYREQQLLEKRQEAGS